MRIGGKEHSDLMTQFESEYKNRRLDREGKEMWPKGVIYQNGEVNELFLAYRRGYALGITVDRKDLA